MANVKTRKCWGNIEATEEEPGVWQFKTDGRRWTWIKRNIGALDREEGGGIFRCGHFKTLDHAICWAHGFANGAGPVKPEAPNGE